MAAAAPGETAQRWRYADDELPAGQTLNVEVYCRAGQKRSVALATIMYQCLASVTGGWRQRTQST
jgi:hypothetical protein